MDGNLDVAHASQRQKTGDGSDLLRAVDINFERGQRRSQRRQRRALRYGREPLRRRLQLATTRRHRLAAPLPSTSRFDHVVVDRNGEAGALFGVDGDVRITDASFSNNVLRDGLAFDNAVRLVAARIVASGNGRDGLEAPLTHATILASRFEENGQDGVELSPRNPPGEFVLRATTSRATRAAWS